MNIDGELSTISALLIRMHRDTTQITKYDQIQELSDDRRQMVVTMYIAKTKVIVNNVIIKYAVYLGRQHYNMKERARKKRRIVAGWAAYTKHRDLVKSNLAICLKRQVCKSSENHVCFQLSHMVQRQANTEQTCDNRGHY